MPCSTAKTMRFRVYKIDLLPNRTEQSYIHNHPETYIHNEVGSFSITSPDDTLSWSREYYRDPNCRDSGISDISIVAVMFKKLFNFTPGPFTNGWCAYWDDNKRYIAGIVSGNTFYLKRIT